MASYTKSRAWIQALPNLHFWNDRIISTAFKVTVSKNAYTDTAHEKFSDCAVYVCRNIQWINYKMVIWKILAQRIITPQLFKGAMTFAARHSWWRKSAVA